MRNFIDRFSQTSRDYKIKILGGLFPTAFSFKIVCFSIAWLFARRAIERYNNSTDKIHS